MADGAHRPDPAVVNEFVDEITRLLRQRSLVGVSITRTVRLDSLADVTADSANTDRFIAIGRLLEECARSIENPDLSRASLALVERLGEFRPEKDRGRSAGLELGVSYHAFRRQDAHGVSHRDRVVLALARQMAAQVPPESNRSGFSPRSTALVMITAIAAVAIVMFFRGRSSSPHLNDQAANSMETAAASNSAIPTTPVIEPSAGTEEVIGPDVFAGDPVLGDREPSCDIGPGELGVLSGPDADEASAEFALAYTQYGGRTAIGCPSESMRLSGGIYWQTLERGYAPNGGLVGGAGHNVQILNSGQWSSYYQVGDILGGIDAAPVRAGIPMSEAVLTSDGWVLPLDPVGAMYAESENGHYVWVSSPISTLWEQSGGSSGEFGLPITDHIFGPEGLRQDFAHGYATVSAGGAIDWHLMDQRELDADSNDDVMGRILVAFDGTAWLIDAELRRWWLRDPWTWECVGGTANVESWDVAGYFISEYDYAGVVDCPSSKSGVFPDGGMASVDLYCKSNVSIRSSAVFDEGGVPGCSDGKRLQPVGLSTVCSWQYGPNSRPQIDEPIPSFPRCTS